MTYMVLVTIDKIWKSNMGFRLAYLNLILILAHSEGQGHSHFDNEYLENGEG